ncbi:TPA: carbohydrate porin, partial [Enterobacter cloacae]|nr:carbohydrate porin [Enterobacter cloacae]
MKVKNIALLVSAFCSTAAMAANDTQRLEDKLAQLEARLEKAETRAAKAEAQIQVLEQQQHPVVAANPVVVESTEPATAQTAPKLTLSGYGD